MKNKLTAIILLSSAILTLASCASRKYGCPATAYTQKHSNKI
ncbi:MAG: hypothetical protein JWP88_1542 [Flaviaesturariibacter sp.]|nr:hypothetical protein [Flaviaesturariibacter sp.]